MLYFLFVIILFLCSIPLQAMIAFAIFLFSGSPILYRQKRMGYRGKPFILYKFRTMVLDAEEQKPFLRKKNEANGPVFKIRNDPRFTQIGKFLSHTGLDELPQLFNVVIGDMALFGPRPLPLSEAKKLTSYQHRRELIKPGIFSPWIIDGYHKKNFEAWMESDIAYAKSKTTVSDFRLFAIACFFMLELFAKEVRLLFQEKE